ncbi:MAG: ABC transporter ATP-binding protein [Ruminococcaceae bacterium]|nr:ABC transporter ATP-binding protein [Oscillospiraceae bacterium]
MSEAVIKVTDVTKVYKLYEKPMDRLKEALSLTHKSYHTDHYALNGISLEVGRGECVGIIGTNGSGKSTLLKIITGVLNPTQGSVEIEGKISALLELGAGFNMEYTGVENIYLNGTMMGFTREEMEERVQDIIDFAEIGEFIHQPVKTYSSGMFARLAFAVAINVDPDILIVDEALSVGDIFFQAKCFRKFNEFKDKGKTILFVSHDLSSVLKYCERSLLIHRGNQIAVGKSNEVVDIYKKILANQYDENEQEVVETKIEEPADTQSFEEGSAWKNSMVQNVNCVEYGEKDAEIIDYAVVDEKGNIGSTVDKGTKFTIKSRVRFHKAIDNPIFTFTIKDRKGTPITGTNTMLESKTLDRVEAGTDVVVSFKQTMNLQGGQYLLSVSCTGYDIDNLIIHHRLYDVCFLEVFSTKDSVGYYDMDSDVTYEFYK